MFRNLIRLFVLISMFGAANATYKPEFKDAPLPVQQWFQIQGLTPSAAKRLHIVTCCDHADRFKTKFVATGDGHWYYYADQLCQKEGCKLTQIPDDTIHQEGIQAINPKDDDLPEFKQMRAEGVLMIWNGQITCFWPPQTGI